MATKHEAFKAIKAGVQRQHCELISCDFSDADEVTVVVKGLKPLAQIGREYNVSQKDPNEIALRVSRFCSHYANGKAFKFQWGESLI